MTSITDPAQRTIDYFHDEVINFRKIMTSTEYSTEEVELALDGLTLLYLNVDVEDDEQLEHIRRIYWSTAQEWSRRRAMEVLSPISRKC